MHDVHVVSVNEVLPKERKAKEEKTVMIGMASIDLIPLLLGEIVYTFMRHISHLGCTEVGVLHQYIGLDVAPTTWSQMHTLINILV